MVNRRFVGTLHADGLGKTAALLPAVCGGLFDIHVAGVVAIDAFDAIHV